MRRDFKQTTGDGDFMNVRGATTTEVWWVNEWTKGPVKGPMNGPMDQMDV